MLSSVNDILSRVPPAWPMGDGSEVGEAREGCLVWSGVRAHPYLEMDLTVGPLRASGSQVLGVWPGPWRVLCTERCTLQGGGVQRTASEHREAMA